MNFPTQKIIISTTEGRYFFRPEEIVRLQASSNYTYMHFINRKPLLVSRVLADYEELLSAFGFVRTHRSHLVNKSHVMYIDRSGCIIMQDDSRAEISRRKKKQVLKELKNSLIWDNMAA